MTRIPANRLDPELVASILERLGLPAAPPIDLAGLRRIYGAWCARVPFDNVAKLLALRAAPEAPLPPVSSQQFFERYLEHGTGGTCWTSSDALCSLLESVGFPARRVAGSMRDTGIVSHGSVKVTFGSNDWLVDSSLLTNEPLPLSDDLFTSDDPVFQFEVEPVNGTHVVWSDLPPSPYWIPCPILVDPATTDFYEIRWQASKARSPFNERIYARRNRPGEMLIISANRRYSKTKHGLDVRELDAGDLCDSLRNELGISGEYIRQLLVTGIIDASMKPSAGEPPPPITARPPSQRAHSTGESHDPQAEIR
jgi:N-hydroxyarylamine O-acetyltransferase